MLYTYSHEAVLFIVSFEQDSQHVRVHSSVIIDGQLAIVCIGLCKHILLSSQ